MRAFILAVAGVTLGITACNSGVAVDGITKVPVISVAVVLPSETLVVGQSEHGVALPKDANGTVLTGRVIEWSSSDNSAATVDGDGLITAVGPGIATISARCEGIHWDGPVWVVRPVASVGVTPPSSSMQVGGSAQLAASPRDMYGNSLVNRAVTWSSSNTGVASVSSSGLVIAASSGSTTITATSEGKTGSATVSVSSAAPAPVATVTVSPSANTIQVGTTTQLAATTRDLSGNTLTGRTVSWSSNNTGVATVSGSGVVTAAGVGSATITATSEGMSGTAAITVSAIPPAPVATVTVTPPTSSIQVGATAQLTATTRDGSGNTLTGRAVSWSSNNTGVAQVSSSGLVTAIAIGSATITASSEGQSGTATVTVTAIPPAPVATVTVAPSSNSIQAGATAQLTATTRDGSGNTLTGRVVTWSSNNTAAATVNGSGLVSAVAAGSATITATSEGKSGTATVTVTAIPPAPVATVTVAPSTNSIQVGRTAQLAATTRDGSGNTLTGRVVTWSSNNTVVATVSSSGLVTAATVGSATITATSEGKTGTAAVTVTAVTPPGSAPEPVSGDITLLQDSFDGATVAAMTANYATRGTIQRVTDGRSGSAIRFAYSSSSFDNLIEANFQTTQDVYFRFWYRTTPGADPTNGDNGSSGFKWFMAWRPNSTIRYTFGVNSLDNAAGPPSAEPNTRAEFTSHDNSSSQEYNPFIQNIAKTPKFTTTNDGQWHKYTLHIVTGTGTTDTRSGYEQIWVDGILVLDTRAYPVDHDPTGIALIQFPGTVVNWDATQPNFNIDIDDLVVWHH